MKGWKSKIRKVRLEKGWKGEGEAVKLFRQFGIILLVTFFAELLENLLPLPVPASIYGLVLMLAGLIGKVIPLEQVEQAADFLIDIMPVMFIPAAAGILNSYGALKEMLTPLCVILTVTTVLVMVVTGRVSQWMIRRGRRDDEERKSYAEKKHHRESDSYREREKRNRRETISEKGGDQFL